MNIVRYRGIFLAFTIIAIYANPTWSKTFSDDFISLTIDQNTVTSSSILTCMSGSDPEDITMTVPPGEGNWAMVVSPNYPYTWAGTDATQSWAIVGGVMYTHAEKTNNDDGLAWISREPFNRSKYLSATSSFSMDTCLNWVAGCMAGLTLIVSEADYREIGMRSTGDYGMVKLSRLAPCDERDMLDASGNTVTMAANQLHNIRIDYLGPDGGGWRYWLDGTQLYLDAGGISNVEPPTFLGAPLGKRLHVGIFYTGTRDGTGNKYVEGRVDRVNVYALTKVVVSSATASNSYLGYPASQAVDNNVITSWSAGGFPSQWIELDIGSIQPIRKVRLLTSQNGRMEARRTRFMWERVQIQTLLQRPYREVPPTASGSMSISWSKA